MEKKRRLERQRRLEESRLDKSHPDIDSRPDNDSRSDKNGCLDKNSRPVKSQPKCGNRSVKEDQMKAVALEAINRVMCQGDDYLDVLEENVATVVSEAMAPEEIDKRLNCLQRELLERAGWKEDYGTIADEILELRDMRTQCIVDQGSLDRSAQIRQISTLKDFIRKQPTEIEEFDEQLVRLLIGRITVYKDRFVVEFKWGSGVVVEG